MLNRPLVVDLDGSLIKTDLLFETANSFVAKHPYKVWKLIPWFLSGKGTLKAKLAECSEIDAASLPYNKGLLAWLREQKAGGRQLVLATASHIKLAEAVAQHLELFDEVLATEGGVNLKAERKRDLLVSRFGENRFDYVGDCSADLPVWRSAGDAYLIGSSALLIGRVKKQANLAGVFADDKPPLLQSLARALRPHQWLKNLLLFVPLLSAHLYGDGSSVMLALLAFLVFGMTASSVYVLNDLIDVADDRHHLRKRNRPFASGDLSLVHGWITWPLLLLMAFFLAALTLPPLFLGVLGTYYLVTLAYSLFLKRTPIVDVLTLAALYTLRIIAGAAAIAVLPTFWLLLFSMFVFLSLAFMKRFSELKAAKDAHRLRGRGYAREDLELVSSAGVAAGYLATLVLALYIQDQHTAEIYRTPSLIWLACPLLLYWISRAWLVAHRGDMHDDPIVFAIKDKISWIVGFCLLGVFGLAKLAG